VVVPHLRPSREQVAGYLESQALRRCHLRVQTHSRDGRREQCCRGGISEQERAVATRYFSHWPRRIFLWGQGRDREEVELAVP
jgi:hypothetical protein